MGKTIRAIKTKSIHLHPNQLLKMNNLTLSLKIATLTIATLAIYHQDLTIIINDALQSEITNYILAIPFIFTYLIYRKRKMIKKQEPKSNANRFKITFLIVSSFTRHLICM